MQLIHVPDSTYGAALLTERLMADLSADKRVLWFIPGGSNIPVSKAIMDSLDATMTTRLSLALTDERYGPVGHIDSNWQQLDDIGFDRKAATRYDVLHNDTDSLEAATARYADTIADLLSEHDSVVGQFGMGADGHIAGILPYSNAAASQDWAAGYRTETFDRITMTFKAIERVDALFLFAFGAEKRAALEQLDQAIELEEQPAQIIKNVPEAFVFNDQIGDTV